MGSGVRPLQGLGIKIHKCQRQGGSLLTLSGNLPPNRTGHSYLSFSLNFSQYIPR